MSQFPFGDWNYLRSAYYTKSIDFEKEKLVSTLYFSFSIMFFILLISDPSLRENKLMLLQTSLCDVTCIYNSIIIILITMFTIMMCYLIWNGLNMNKKAETVALYLFCISSPVVSRSTVESLTRSIDAGDWKTTEYWKNKLQKEIKFEEGLHEQRKINLQKHIKIIIEKFRKHKQEIDEKNHQQMLDIYFISIIPKLTSAPLYR